MRRNSLPLLVSFFAAVLSVCSTASFGSLKFVNSAPHAALWQQLYSELPGCWKTDRIVSLQELSPEEMADYASRHGDTMAGNGAVDGCYESGGRTRAHAGMIRLCVTEDGTPPDLMFAHEYAHFIWDEKLTRAQRARFARLWERQEREGGRFVTEYASDGVEEGFAEAVAYFLRRPEELLERDPDSAAFLNDVSRAAATASHANPRWRALSLRRGYPARLGR